MTKNKIIVAALVAVAIVLVVGLLALRADPVEQAQQEYEAAHAQQHAAQAEAPPAPAAGVQPETQEAAQAEAHAGHNHAVVNIETAAEDMWAVLDVAANAIRDGNMGYYNLEDDEFFWHVLLDLCSTYPEMIPGLSVQEGEDFVRVPAETMRRLAAVCFAGRTELPATPADWETLRYDEASDAYIVELSDRGDVASEVLDFIPEGEESYTASVALLQGSDAEAPPLLSTYHFILVPAAADAPFPLQIIGGYDSPNVLAQLQGVEEKDGEVLITFRHARLAVPEDAAQAEAFDPVVETQGDALTFPLYAKEAVDYNALAVILSEGEVPFFEDAEEAFDWFEDNYDKEVLGEGLLLQMRFYDGVIYSMAPLYSFYFQG